MKKLFSSTIIVLLTVCYVHAQQPAGKTPPVPVAPAAHDHDHAGHDHDHDHDHDHGAEEATPKVANPNAAKIAFKEETYNFGDIPEGPQVTHEFKFTNT